MIFIGSAVLIASLFLPWYTLTSTCGQNVMSTGLSAIRAGGWRFDIVAVMLATVVAAVFDTPTRVITVALAGVLLLLCLFWVSNNYPPGVSAPVCRGPGSVPVGGTGFGAYLGVASAAFVLVGAAMHSATSRRQSSPS